MKKALLIPVLALFAFFLVSGLQAQDKPSKAKATEGSCCGEEESCGADKATCSEENHHQKAEAKTSSVSKPWNTVCPVQGEKVDPKVKTVKYEGKEYGFCCNGCDAKFQKDPAKYAKNLSKDGKKFVGKKA